MYDLQDGFKKFSRAILVFRFNSAMHGVNLMKVYLLPILVIERGLHPIVIKEDYQSVSFKIGNVQSLVNLEFWGENTYIDSFLEAQKIMETKLFLP